MKVQAFKQIIKEAVAEAVREELAEILSQKPQLNESKTVTFTSANIAGGGNIREQLHSQMGAMFGYQQSQRNDLKIIDKWIEEVLFSTGFDSGKKKNTKPE